MRLRLIFLIMFGITAGCVQSTSDEQIRLIEEEARHNRVLDHAESQFEKGEFASSSETLKEALASSEAMTKPYRARFFLLQARLATAFNKPAEIRLWLGKLFAVDQDAQLDPLRDPPLTLAIWQDLRVDDNKPKPGGG